MTNLGLSYLSHLPLVPKFNSSAQLNVSQLLTATSLHLQSSQAALSARITAPTWQTPTQPLDLSLKSSSSVATRAIF